MELFNRFNQKFCPRRPSSGRYFDLVWTPEPKPSADAAASVDLDLPDIFTAFREQLGLKLESRKEPAKVIVVDGATRPSEN